MGSRDNDLLTNHVMTRNEIFARVSRLLGDDSLRLLESSRVIVFGVGGVGSWCAESLVRTGISHITIVDADRVVISNINRQLMATTATVGRTKVDVLAARLHEIDPEAEVVAINARYTPETAADFHLEEYDYVIDAIDSLTDKAHLILSATAAPHTVLFSSMGAALKMDPSRIHVAEFWKVTGCPLGAALRRKFKKSGLFPRHKFKCVYSDELLTNQGEDGDRSGAMSYNKVSINGAICHITAIFGFTLASLVINDIVKRRMQ